MERVITACSMPFFAKGDFTMGVFSEIAMEQQNSMFDSSAAFEDDEAFELEEIDRKSTRLNSSHIEESRMPSSA